MQSQREGNLETHECACLVHMHLTRDRLYDEAPLRFDTETRVEDDIIIFRTLFFFFLVVEKKEKLKSVHASHKNRTQTLNRKEKFIR